MGFHRVWLSSVLLVVTMVCVVRGDEHAGQRIAIDDKTGPDNPLEVSGHVSFSESLALREVTSSRSEDLRVRNVSTKPILFLLATLQEAGPKSSEQDIELVVDKFFEEKAFLPGAEMVLLQRPPGQNYITEPFRAALIPERPARAQFWVRFVQFSDGSTFGDPATARDWLAKRDSTLRHLRVLREICSERGEAAFVHALEEAPPDRQPDSKWNQIRQLEKASGLQAALNFIDQALANASRHKSQLTNPATDGTFSSHDR